MSSLTLIDIEKRDSLGTGAARAARRDGLIPGILYGEGEQPEPISISKKSLNKELNHSGIFSRVFNLKINKGKAQMAIVKHIQFHPVTDDPLHIDFMRVSKSHSIIVKVPLTFINEENSPGLKRGGVLNAIIHELEISCPVDAVPDHIEVDLSGMDFHDSVHANQIKLSKGIELVTHGRDLVILTIVAPTVMHAEEASVEQTTATTEEPSSSTNE